ncbi:MAG: hypothetical protein V1738_00100 [Patescibacteria group bacterium]
MINETALAFHAMQHRAQRILGPIFFKIKEIFPEAGWFEVDIDFKQVSFVPGPVFAVPATKLGLLHLATGASEITVKKIRIGPEDSGIRPVLILSGLNLPHLELDLSGL